MDVRGNPIMKGRKFHKVVFADSNITNLPLYEVHRVESFKMHNKLNTHKKNVACCSIF